MSRKSPWLLVASALGCSEPTKAPTPVSLAPANATLTETFTNVNSIRELSDGRVILSDARDNRVVVTDFTTGKVEPVSRPGSGPGEYERAGPIYALGGDSSLLSGVMSPRSLVLDGTKVVATLTPDSTGAGLGFTGGADQFGNVMDQVAPPLDPNGWPLHDSDSISLVLVNWRSNARDTVGRMWMTPRPQGPTPVHMLYGGIYERTVLARDGWAAVIRINPYRVDWRKPDGQWIRGAPIRLPEEKMDAHEKEAILRRRAKLGADTSEKIEWPATIPPFAITHWLLVSPDGKLLVRKNRTADYPARYDVIDRQGKLERQIVVPENAAILGFGEKSVYLVDMDEDDLQHISRHPWP